jgi:hypothetical protein
MLRAHNSPIRSGAEFRGKKIEQEKTQKQARTKRDSAPGRQTPILDHRNPDQIIGYDESGLRSSDPKPKPTDIARGEAGAWEPFDFADRKKKVLHNPASRALIEDFLKNRHRAWELEMEADLKARQEAKAGRTQKS